ncbi:hypothetical protein F5141DRAFT_470558 [Pisolithus sp. B1]|nr:hypothetical protein F5141DRAFT_470558 [Pisolithus sp. B1]
MDLRKFIDAYIDYRENRVESSERTFTGLDLICTTQDPTSPRRFHSRSVRSQNKSRSRHILHILLPSLTYHYPVGSTLFNVWPMLAPLSTQLTSLPPFSQERVLDRTNVDCNGSLVSSRRVVFPLRSRCRTRSKSMSGGPASFVIKSCASHFTFGVCSGCQSEFRSWLYPPYDAPNQRLCHLSHLLETMHKRYFCVYNSSPARSLLEIPSSSSSTTLTLLFYLVWRLGIPSIVVVFLSWDAAVQSSANLEW